MTLRAFLTIVLLACANHFSVLAQVSTLNSLKIDLENHPNKDSIRVKILNQIAFETYYRSVDMALGAANEAFTISETIGYKKGLAEAHREIALVFWTQANYSAALEMLFKGLKMIEGDARYVQMEADLLGNIGMVYNSLANYDQAIEFLNRSLFLQRVLKNSTREATMLNNLGDSYRFQKQFEKALEVYSQALKLRISSGNLVTQGTNIRNIGNVYEAQGELGKALENYFKSLQIAETKNDRRGISLSQQSIASVYFKKKQYALANQYALKSLILSREDNQKSTLRDSYNLLWQLAETQKQFSNALDYYKLFTLYKDSVENVKISSQISSTRLNYEMQKKQTEIDILKKDGELKEAINDRNKILLGSAFCILVLGSILFFRQKTISKILTIKNSEIIIQQNEIAEQRDELITLNEEIRAQQEEVTAQRDTLFEKNNEVQLMNSKIMEVNENLEKLIAERTSILEEQNKRLSEYAFHNAHKLRAPLASILGLVNLMYKNPSADDFNILLDHLKKSSEDLDAVVKSINKSLQVGMDAYPEKGKNKSPSSRIE